MSCANGLTVIIRHGQLAKKYKYNILSYRFFLLSVLGDPVHRPVHDVLDGDFLRANPNEEKTEE